MLGAPELHTALQVRSHESPVEGKNHCWLLGLQVHAASKWHQVFSLVAFKLQLRSPTGASAARHLHSAPNACVQGSFLLLNPSCPLAGGTSKPAPRAEGGTCALTHAYKEAVGGREVTYEAEHSPAPGLPLALVWSECLGGSAAVAAHPWPGTEPPLCLRGSHRYPVGEVRTAVLVVSWGGSEQEGKGRGGQCCGSSGAAPLSVSPLLQAQELQEDGVPAHRPTGAGVEEVAGDRALRAALP